MWTAVYDVEVMQIVIRAAEDSRWTIDNNPLKHEYWMYFEIAFNLSIYSRIGDEVINVSIIGFRKSIDLVVSRVNKMLKYCWSMEQQ